jgi:hypothetical protein
VVSWEKGRLPLDGLAVEGVGLRKGEVVGGCYMGTLKEVELYMLGG